MIDEQRIHTELFRTIIALQDAHAYLGHVEQMFRDAGAMGTECASCRLARLRNAVLTAIDLTTAELRHYQSEASER